MLVFFLIIGYNVKENFNDHKFINTFNQGCVRGFYCPKDTDYAKKCNRGYYCPDGKLKVQCKEGSFCPGNLSGLYGDSTPSRSYKEQICPNGYYCPSSNLLNGTFAKPCSEGKICCYRGETNEELLFGDCKTNDELKKAIFDKTTYPGSMGWRSRSSEKKCPSGFYCPVDADGNSDGRIIKCQSGDYCPAGSTKPGDCPIGYYCPSKKLENGKTIYGTRKIKCKVDSIDSKYNKSGGCQMDVNGIEYCAPYCPARSTNKRYCKRGHYCPSVISSTNGEKLFGTVEKKCGDDLINEIPGWKGTFKEVTKDDGTKENVPLKGGKYQKYKGSLSCMECPSGISSNNTRTRCNGCPAGHFCTDLNTSPQKCLPGTYTPITYACKENESCIGGNKSQIYSKEANYPTECFQCPPGQYQAGTGKFQCLACPKGTSQALFGQTKCNDCIGGEYQDREGGKKCKKCDAGHYCSNCLTQKSEDGCKMQDCYWDNVNKLCSPKRILKEIIKDINLNDWKTLGLIPMDGTIDDAIQLIQKQRTITKTTKDRIKAALDKKQISTEGYLKISKY
ncbi:MAG: hypothetical protein HOM24_06745, partial [Flavobacteriales bacterium]|nr:hypothetical protein [Flavobacteriales bacterium]